MAAVKKKKMSTKAEVVNDLDILLDEPKVTAPVVLPEPVGRVRYYTQAYSRKMTGNDGRFTLVICSRSC